MNGGTLLELSEAQVVALEDLVKAEMDRQLELIHNLLQGRYTTMGGYKEPECWGEVKVKVLSLVRSPLVSLERSLVSEPVKPADPGAGSGS